MQMLPGTRGFSYTAWKGTAHPEDLPSGGMSRSRRTRLPA